MILVSIIVPVYNVEKYLERCVNSILTQSYSNIQIILVDDGSPDHCPEMCDEFVNLDKRVQVIHKSNGGLASARNAGLDVATGDYVCFIDSDDWVENNYVAEMLTGEKQLSKDVVVCSFYIDYINDKICVPLKFEENKVYDFINIRDGIIALEKADMFNSVWNKLYRRSILETENLRFFINSEPAEDLLFNVNYFKFIENMELISTPLYHYVRQDETSMTNKYIVDLFNKSKKFNEVQKSLYTYWKLDKDSAFDIFKKKYIYRLFSCVPNLYRKNALEKKKERLYVFGEMMRDNDLLNYIRSVELDDFNLKLFVNLLEKRNVKLMDLVYRILFYIRNNMTWFYMLLRKRMRKSREYS